SSDLGEHHPVVLVGLDGTELPELADLFHGGYLQHGMGSRRKKERRRFMVSERLRELRLDDPVAETNQIAGRRVTHSEPVDAPHSGIEVLRLFAFLHAVVWRGPILFAGAHRFRSRV